MTDKQSTHVITGITQHKSFFPDNQRFFVTAKTHDSPSFYYYLATASSITPLIILSNFQLHFTPMATSPTSLCKLSSSFLPIRSSYYPRALFRLHAPTFPIFRQTFAAKIHASSSTALVENAPMDKVVTENDGGSSKNNILACPICYEALTLIGDSCLSIGNLGGSRLQCNTCKKTYSGKDTHIELTAASGATNYRDAMPLSTEFFRLPLISFLYERGWRQNFAVGGFPGPEQEFELIKDYMKPVLGGNIIDASCGSGLFARLFAKSGLFSLVVALDYSENMLQQCYEFANQEENFPKEKLILVRADISRLPFTSGSIDAVHAGAAIHCWPSPSSAVAEISRVLRPGGVFVGTTYLLDGLLNFAPLLRPLRQNIMQISGSHMFLREQELEDICKACGLVDFKCTRNRQFVMFTATKPS